MASESLYGQIAQAETSHGMGGTEVIRVAMRQYRPSYHATF